MTQTSVSGFGVQPSRGASSPLRVFGLAAATLLLFLATPCVQAQSDSNSNAATQTKPGVSGSPAASQDVASRPAPPSPSRHAVEEPTRAPVVAWDGKQLTIDAENSTLADILEAVRAQTGASIEMPSTASTERVFVHLGPGPPRDILSSLVYGMPFDYVIETADNDPDTLHKIVLTAQGAGDSDSVVAGTASAGDGTVAGGPPLHRGGGDGRARAGVRMMPGWAGPGMPSFQADAEATLAAKEAAAQDSSATQDSAEVKDPVATQDAAEAKESAAPQNAAESKDFSASPPATDPAEVVRAASSSPSTSESSDQSGVGQAIQNMTQMFEQRRQLQSQQNQRPTPPPQQP